MKCDAAARIFASHYQLVVCDDPAAYTEETNWTKAASERGFAGNNRFRMIGTEADLNDHWVEALIASEPPDLEAWHRVTCVDVHCTTGRIHVMGIMDQVPAITLEAQLGRYSVYVAACNLGIDLSTFDDDTELTDEELAARKDLEWYRVFIVLGTPKRLGQIKTEGPMLVS